MRAAEFAAEIAILLIEGGPQHKKIAIDLYYHRYSDRFSEGSAIETRLRAYIAWIEKALPEFQLRRYRRSNELYALIGALDIASRKGTRLSSVDPALAGQKLLDFERQTQSKSSKGDAAQYVIAASKHTDDLEPRRTRIEILGSLLA
jgi:hypothetical protein